ncbi:MAG: hypothetical protein ABIJ33_02350 [Patescibacteria group bacterium]
MSVTLSELQQKTAQIEAEKNRKQAERVRRRQKREQAEQHQLWEKLIAPIILIISILVSLIIYYF